MARKRKAETDAQFLRRVDRTIGKKVKDGGPTTNDLVRAIQLRLGGPVSGGTSPAPHTTHGERR